MTNIRVLLLACLVAGAGLGLRADTFYWTGTATGWGASGAWNHGCPNAAGDLAKIGPATVTVDGDYTVGALSITNQTSIVSDGSVRAITLDSGVAGKAAELYGHLVDWSSPRHSYIGSGSSDNNLVLNLASPLSVYNTGANSASQYFWIPAKITGGSAAAPCDLSFAWDWGWGLGELILMNPSNDFRGDITVTAKSGSSASSLLFAGGGDTRFSDSILGDAANEIYLVSYQGQVNAKLAISRADASGILNRKIHGRGTVCGLNRNANNEAVGDLHLGPNCLIDPGLDTSAAAEIAVTGSSVTMAAGTTFRLTLGTDFNDKVSFAPAQSFTFNGAVEFDYATSAEDIEDGAQFVIFTVSAVAFSFAPSSFPAGYSWVVSGDSGAGWTVTAVKNASYALVQMLDTTLVGDTFATLNANVTMPDSGAVDTTVRFYYGTTDGGSDPSAWSHYVDYPQTVTSAGAVSVTISGLTLGSPTYVRAAATSSGHTEFATSSGQFTTRALSAANTFTWLGADGDWSVAANWFNPTCYARLVPGYAGDTVIADVSGTKGKAIYLAADQTVGFVDAQLQSGSYNTPLRFYAFDAPVTLTLDPGSVDTTSRISTSVSNPQVVFGNQFATNQLTVALAGPLEIWCPNASGGNSTYVNCKLTGGTVENPCPITLRAHDNYWRVTAFYLDNVANDFVGDIYVGSAAACSGRCFLHVGGNDCRTDAVLGNVANRVFLRNTSVLNYLGNWRNQTAVCNRTVLGNGTIRSATSTNGDVNDNQTYPLQLSATARLEPQSASGEGYGTISFLAKSLAFDADATIQLDLDPAGGTGDAIAVKVSEAFTLGGKLEITDKSAKAKSGMSWTIATIDASCTSFVNGWKRPSGYEISTAGNATDGWTVTLTKLPAGLILTFR